MRHVPVAEFETNVAEVLAVAEGGEDVVLTRDGREVLKLVPLETDRLARQRRAIEAMLQTREQLRQAGVRISAADIIAWKNEGRP